MSNLLIVESPAKAKTIEKYLGKDYKVLATLGHIIDLPKNKIAVNIENEYKPEFVVMDGKKKTIATLKKSLPKKGEGDVLLAMDPDREGEAIAWHTMNALKLKNPKRVVFHEITKDAVVEAIKKPRQIDDNLVDAQIARRVLDRLVGYKLSQLLWKKMWYGLSAGRVQSVALKLVVERENEILAFVPKEYWEIKADCKTAKDSDFVAELVKIDGKKANIGDATGSDAVVKALENKDFTVDTIAKKTVQMSAKPPFTTSTLQQSSNNILGYSTKRTMSLAQQLYQAGYITYMRTDSVNLAQQAVEQIREKIKSDYGEKYLSAKTNYFKNKARLAQEAHEAIRPSHFDVPTEKVAKELGAQAAKLYDIIFKRALACQMAPQVVEKLEILLSTTGSDKKKYGFSAKADNLLFDGYSKVWGKKFKDSEDLKSLGEINEGERVTVKKLIPTQKFTEPKSRYTEATLVKALEKHGVGRPSTYATIISTIIDRGYVIKEEKYLKPKDVGFTVTNFLQSNFKRLVDYSYTAKVEEDLDNIAEGKVKYFPFIDNQYQPLVTELGDADKISKDQVLILGDSDEKCPECQSPMQIKLGRYGKFLTCSRFPECKGMKGIAGSESQAEINLDKYIEVGKCEKCGADMVMKTGRFGNFWACSAYPKCKNIVSAKLKEKCPKCGKPLVEKKGKWGKTFIGCSGYPKCKYIKKK